MRTAQGFSVVDYCVFVGVLLSSLFIGIFYAFRGKQTNDDLLLGGRKMSITPVAVSIMVTFLSAILILGSPAEMYMNGVQWWVSTMSFALILPAVSVLFLPIFYRCGLTSVYEYIQFRFDNTLLRVLCVVTYLVRTSLYMAIALYAPSLALTSTTSMPLWTSMVGMAAVATLYTSFGGLKAVIWADVLQALVMAAGMVAIIVQGAINVGGFMNIFYINNEHGRLNLFDFSFDPWQRHNFWNLFFGTLFTWTVVLGVNQSSVQRYLSLPTLKSATIACLLNAPANILYISLACLCGLAIFASYATCDPFKMGHITRKDEIVPYFVLDQMSYLTGLPGLFVACIMSGALSTISSGLNSLAAITWKDFLMKVDGLKDLSDSAQGWIVRGVSCMYGCVAVGLAFIVSKLGGVLQASLAINGALSGPILGVFSLGIFVPFANGKGALAGLLTAHAISLWVVFGSYGSGKQPTALPTSTRNCPSNTTSISPTALESAHLHTDDPSWVEQYVYGISYQLYNLVGCFMCVIVGSIVSLLTGCNQRRVNKNLVNPVSYRLMNWININARDEPDDVKYAADNPIFNMPTYKQNSTD